MLLQSFSSTNPAHPEAKHDQLHQMHRHQASPRPSFHRLQPDIRRHPIRDPLIPINDHHRIPTVESSRLATIPIHMSAPTDCHCPELAENRESTIPCILNCRSLNFFSLTQCLLVSHEWRGHPSAGTISARRAHRTRHSTTSPTNQHANARRGRLRRHNIKPHEIRLHRRKRLRQGVGHLATWQQESRQSIGLLGELHQK